MIPFRRLGILCCALTLCPAPGPPGAALAHDDRLPHESREWPESHDAERTSDSSGRGSREDSSRGDGSRDGTSCRREDDRRGRDSGRRDGERRTDGRRESRVEFERDSRGAERVRGEVLVVGSHDEVAALRNAGFVLLDVSALSALDAESARVRVPDGRSLDATVDALRRLLPDASVAADHLYRPSGGSADFAVAVPPPPAWAPALPARAIVGVVDTGIEAVTPTLQTALLASRGFAAGGYVPRAHGTAVADIAARAGASLVSADVFGVDSESNLAATTLALAQSVDWLLSNKVRVMNISIVGPDNPIVARVIRKAIDSGAAVVAAAGNSGPSAPPAYPAAYPGVIAVTAVDEKGRVYRRANRGAYIAFAARGVNVLAARPGGGSARESGTSFAAPIVSAALALRCLEHPDESTSTAVAALARGARDLGAAGRDEVFGWGEIEPPRTATAKRQ